MTRLFDAVVLVAAIFVIWLGLYAYAGDAAIAPPWTTFSLRRGAVIPSVILEPCRRDDGGLRHGTGDLGGGGRGAWPGTWERAASLGEVAEPILSSLYTVPKVTLYPAMLLIFGLGMSAKVAFGVIHGMIPVMLFTMAAVKNIRPVLLHTARVLHLSPTQTVLSVLAPAVTPEIITGLRIGFALTLLGVLIGEMFASQRGLGFLIINGIAVHDVRMTTTVTLIVVVFAVAANGLMLALDRRAHQLV